MPAVPAAGAVSRGGGGPPPRRFRDDAYWARPVSELSATRPLGCSSVGLAPAAHGGNRTGRMFTGDAAGGSGEWVARALHAHGFATQPTSHQRGDGFRPVEAYITAALHCVPPDNRPDAAGAAPVRSLPAARSCRGSRRVQRGARPRADRLRRLPGRGGRHRAAGPAPPAAIRPRRGGRLALGRCPLLGTYSSEPSEHPDRQAHLADVRGRLRRSAPSPRSARVSLRQGGPSRRARAPGRRARRRSRK